jgi:uncharacterized protein
VLPFLWGHGLVARVDPKADRQAGALAVLGAYAEPDVLAGALGARLNALAVWPGLDSVTVDSRGDLSRELSRCMTGL